MKQSIKYATLGAIMASTVGCGSLPQRANYSDINNYQGSIADFSANYAQNETALDAAQSVREVQCLEDLAGKPFQNEGDMYNALAKCECDKREAHMLGYGILSTIIDGSKIYLIAKGLESVNNRNGGGGGGLEDTLGSGSQNIGGGSAINP